MTEITAIVTGPEEVYDNEAERPSSGSRHTELEP
jgi:hypothetical protein